MSDIYYYSMSKILFRIAGGRAKNQELGLGHIYRSINLAEHFKNHEIFFLIEDYGGVSKLLKDKGFLNIKKISLRPNLEIDYKKTKNFIDSKKIDLVIVDKYGLKNKYVQYLKKITKTVVISDLKNINFDADLVINGFIGFKNTKTLNKYGTICFLGPKYQILHKNYKKKPKREQPKYFFMITLGGFDEKNIIDIVANQLIKYIDKIKVKIILGPATKKSHLIKNLQLKNYKNLEIVYQVDSLIKEITKTKFGICAGGITSYEFASLGVPTIILCQYKHQIITAKEWEKHEVGLNLGIPNTSFEQNLQKIIQKIVYNEIKLKSKPTLVDGKGANRVAMEILKI